MPRRNDTNDEIEGPYPELAKIVRTLANGVASRVIQRRTGVNFSTALSMLKGERADIRSTIKVARGYKVNPNRLLLASDHEEIPEFDLRQWEGETPELMAALGWAMRPVPDLPLSIAPPSPVPAAHIEDGPTAKRIVFRTGESFVVEKEEGGEPLTGEVSPMMASVVWQILASEKSEKASEEGA